MKTIYSNGRTEWHNFTIDITTKYARLDIGPNLKQHKLDCNSVKRMSLDLPLIRPDGTVNIPTNVITSPMAVDGLPV